jgi:hypothetical protein
VLIALAEHSLRTLPPPDEQPPDEQPPDERPPDGQVQNGREPQHTP